MFFLSLRIFIFFTRLACSIYVDHYCTSTCPGIIDNSSYGAAPRVGPPSISPTSTPEEKLGFILDLLNSNSFLRALRNAFPNSTVSFFPLYDENGNLIGLLTFSFFSFLFMIDVTYTSFYFI
jgi:hypothetical protein